VDVPFPASAFGDRVQLYRRTPGVNTGGGKTKQYTATGGILPCRVVRLAARAKDLAEVTETETTFEVSFPARPGGDVGDLYAWLDPAGAEIDRIAITEAATPRDPGGRMWMAFGVIVQ
jgi:hypothetical protein